MTRRVASPALVPTERSRSTLARPETAAPDDASHESLGDLARKLGGDLFDALGKAVEPYLGAAVRQDITVLGRDLGFQTRDPADASGTSATGSATPNQTFPAGGSVSSTIHLDGSFDLSKLTLSLKASHKDLTGLKVTVTSPSGKQYTLPDPHARSVDGTFDLSSAFAQEPVAGDWKVDVSSKWGHDTGELGQWSLDAQGADAPPPPPTTGEITGSAQPGSAFHAGDTITSKIDIAQGASIQNAHLSLDLTHTDKSGISVFLTNPAGEKIAVPIASDHDMSGSIDLSSALAGQPTAGTWTLTVQDAMHRDSGTLKDWSLDFNKAATPTPVHPDPGGPPVLKKIGHVWVIMMENQDWSNIKGNPDAPYINDVLLPEGAHAENYVAETHPSEPNYIELEAGSSLGIKDDGMPAENHQSTHDHLTRYLTDDGISWKSYQEDIDGKEVPLTAHGLYSPKHNPDLYFDDNTGDNNPNDPFGIAHNRPYSEMAGDLKNGTEPRYSFITPNLIDDGHNQGGPLNNKVAQQDAWLKQQIPMIMASKDYKKDGAIMIVWDEGKEGAHDPSGMILLSPFAKPGYSNDISYSHASTLRTLQEIFGVGPFLGDAKTATDLSDLFQDPSSTSKAKGSASA